MYQSLRRDLREELFKSSGLERETVEYLQRKELKIEQKSNEKQIQLVKRELEVWMEIGEKEWKEGVDQRESVYLEEAMQVEKYYHIYPSSLV